MKTNKRIKPSGLWKVVSNCVLFSLALSTQLTAQISKVSTDLQQLLANPLGTVNVIIQLNAAESALGLTNIALLGGIVKTQYSLIPAVAATLPNAAVTVLAALPAVQYISVDRQLASLNDYTRAAVNASSAAEYGADGTGIGIALIDSGIAAHPDLMNAAGTASRIVHRESFVASKLLDDYGHGTHVAGILAGNGARTI